MTEKPVKTAEEILEYVRKEIARLTKISNNLNCLESDIQTLECVREFILGEGEQ